MRQIQYQVASECIEHPGAQCVKLIPFQGEESEIQPGEQAIGQRGQVVEFQIQNVQLEETGKCVSRQRLQFVDVHRNISRLPGVVPLAFDTEALWQVDPDPSDVYPSQTA